MKQGTVVELTPAMVEGMGVGILWDSKCRGLFARRRVKDGPIRYGVKYRFKGRQVWITFEGQHGARWHDMKAVRWQARAVINTDPGDRDRTRTPLFSEFADQYIQDHVEVRLKKVTAGKVVPRIQNKLVPRFGRHRLDEIRTADVQRWHASMAATPVEANRCLSTLRHMLNAAELWDLVCWPKTPGGYNPTRGVKKYRERSRKVFLDAEQLGALGVALRTLETKGLKGTRYEAVVPNPGAANLFRLALLTGARPGALKGLRHEWVNAEEGVIRIPDGKTGFQAIAMAPAARELYASIPKIKGVPWVFPVRGLQHIENIWDSWSRLRTAAALGDVKPHDLRHTFASHAVAGKESLYMVQQLLGHASPQTTQRYAHLAMDPQQEATGRIGGSIAAALTTAPKDRVIDSRETITQ